MKEIQRHCPLCGGPLPVSELDEAVVLRAHILFLRHRLDELERADVSPQGAETKPAYRDWAQEELADREQLRQRIDQGLQHLEGGYGKEDQP